MTRRPEKGRGLFYTRDSMGSSDLAPPRYVEWARREAARLGVTLAGTPEAIEGMIARKASADGDLYLDYGLAGNTLARPGFEAFRRRALADLAVSHLFVPLRERIARLDNPVEAVQAEIELRYAGLTLVFQDEVAAPFRTGEQVDVLQVLPALLAYGASGKFRRDLARKLIEAKVRLAGQGFTIGGDPPYGFERWLCSTAGEPKRRLEFHERVKLPGHHVVWLPTAEAELVVLRRILALYPTTPAARIAAALNADGIPSPNAGRTYTTAGGHTVPVSGLWTQNGVRNAATHPALEAVMEYGRRAFGDQLRFTPTGPRALEAGDYGENKKLLTVTNPPERRMATPVPVDRPPVLTAAERAALLAVAAARGQGQRGKPRARGDAPNPLGGRVFDLNCGWLMYRYQRRGRWCYTCGLYQNSEARCCDHNVIGGAAATRFVLACLRQRVLSAGAADKLRARLRQLAAGEVGGNPADDRRAGAEAELARVKRQLETAGRNMALAADDDEREAMRATYNGLKADRARLERELAQSSSSRAGAADPEREVAAALAGLDRLTELADAADADVTAVGALFARVDVKLYLRFRREERGRQAKNVPAGGVLTFGSTPPPVPLYEGPVDRPVIKRMIAAGEPVSSVPGNVSPGEFVTGQSVGGSANVKRGTTRCC